MPNTEISSVASRPAPHPPQRREGIFRRLLAKFTFFRRPVIHNRAGDNAARPDRPVVAEQPRNLDRARLMTLSSDGSSERPGFLEHDLFPDQNNLRTDGYYDGSRFISISEFGGGEDYDAPLKEQLEASLANMSHPGSEFVEFGSDADSAATFEIGSNLRLTDVLNDRDESEHGFQGQRGLPPAPPPRRGRLQQDHDAGMELEPTRRVSEVDGDDNLQEGLKYMKFLNGRAEKKRQKPEDDPFEKLMKKVDDPFPEPSKRLTGTMEFLNDDWKKPDDFPDTPKGGSKKKDDSDEMPDF